MYKHLFKITATALILIVPFFSDIFSQKKVTDNKPQGSYVTFTKEKGSFTISESGISSPIFVDSKDFTGVIRAVKDLQSDVKNVTDFKPALFVDKMPVSNEIVIIGTLGKNSVIDNLVSQKKIDAGEIKGKWETFIIQQVDNPMPEVKKALVIVGSDKRGTIYGIYDLSEKIGVSPWYWWADVPVQHHEKVYVLPGIHSNGEPKVKYRGIFINDEAPALTGWANEKFGGLNNKFYVKVFELILRLKGNYLWPAMWGNNFDDDDSLNQKLADVYGIVMGTSHHEPMMRSWKEWPKYGHGAWNYQTNDSALREYWREGIKRMNSYESIITLGMRGDGDEAMSASANTSLLERIVSDQRKIIGEVTGKDVTTIPQVWALYKEVQEYYDKGMRVPDDVTLLLCDDNWGNLRKLPKLDAKPRKGGYGIYYHFDYVGGPRNYKWLNTNQISRVWEQMHLAYEYYARQIWIVNVGDIKPMEYPISFFLDYAWNPDNWTADKIPDYSVQWAKQQFGEKHAVEIGNILEEYTRYNSRRKPELLSPDAYSLNNYREFETVVDEYNTLAGEAVKIYNELPENYKDAYYQLVLYPVQACANLNELYFTAAQNRLYAKQGRAGTNALAEKVKKLFEKDADLSTYYNKVMADGKWNHMMDQTHIGYTYWQQPDNNNMPEVKNINIPDGAEMGVAVEGSDNWWPQSKTEAVLPQFDPYNNQKYCIEIFNRGSKPFNYSVKTESYANIDKSEGSIITQQRIFVSIDWKNAKKGKYEIPIVISGPNNSKITVKAKINNTIIPAKDKFHGFVESSGCVSMEAQHYSEAVDGNSVSWLTVPDLGRTLSGVTPVPVTSKSQTPGENDAYLEYKMYLFDKGEVKVNLYFSPTLNFTNSSHGIRYAISIDDESPQIFNMTNNPNPPDLNHDPVWNKWVANNINIQSSKHTINKPGEHVLKFWMIDPGVVLQKIVVDCGGEKPSYLGPPESVMK